MGREKDPFQRHENSQDRGKYEHDPEYDLYEDDEYEIGDMLDEKGSNPSERRTAPPLPPFPSTTRKNYPRRPRANRMPGAEHSTSSLPPKRPAQTARSKRQPPNEPQPLSRRTTGPNQRRSQQPTHNDDFSYRSGSARPMPAKPRRRRVWPIFLIGCASGAVSLVLALAIVVLIGIRSAQNGALTINDLNNGGKAITGESNTQTVPLTVLSQLIVCGVAGNISLSIDPNPNATSASITTTKTALHATDQNEANQMFRQISVSVETPPPSLTQTPLTCQRPQANNTSTSNTLANAAPTVTPTATNNTVLSVKVTFPPNQAGRMTTVDVAILLPQVAVQPADPTNTLITLQDLQGNINIDGINGIMDILDSSGDITVKNGTLVDGSKLEAQGNLAFNGSIWSIAKPPNKRASLFFRGQHQINVTLPETASVTLDATSNIRTATITSDYPIKVDNSEGYPNYRGPFNPAVAIDEKTAPVLHLLATGGNISMHKK